MEQRNMTEEKTNTGGKVQTAAVGERLQTEERIIEVLRTVFDPEIPVNIYDLGLIYRIELDEAGTSLSVDMTLTAPSCPAADFIMEDVRQKLEAIQGIEHVDVQLVFEPEWSQDMMSEEARLELGLM
jgi:FeS assembly SUF system protein